MDSNDITGNAILEPRDDIEFDSHEAAYSFYKDYAKSMGFGTAKLSSRRSRASKEFIDAKFSCIRYGNKQQSDDAINPRPSPKIGCKASLHVKRRQNGKWFIYSFVKEHNHELLPAQAHFFRSHRNDDPPKNDARLRRRKNLAPVSKLFSSLNTSEFHAICGIEEEIQFGSTSKDKVSNSVVINTNNNLGRAEGGKEKGSNVNNANKRGKQVSQPGTFSVGTQAGYHQMGMSDMRPTQLHNFVPAQLHKVLPTMFQNVASTQFHDVATTHLPENRLPR
ncbi:hypothetical protein QYF36_020685 [Acer negundo]|nr:hypothetical protein QYF36_020685 [Acer negundo]